MIRKAILILSGVLCLAAAAARPALADQANQLDQLNDDIQVGAAVKHAANLLVVPLPVIDPAIGKGVAPIAGLFYNPVQGGRQWVTGIGGLYTSNKDWAIGLAQQADLLHGNLRVTAYAGYGNFNLNFFGIGQNAGSQGRSIALDERGAVLMANVRYRVHGSLFVGLRYRFMSIDSHVASPLFPDHPIIPDAELKTRISGLGPSFEFDTRDGEFGPHKGLYIDGQWLFNGPGLGSDFSYNKLNLAGNLYHSLGAKTVVALRGSLCDTSSGAPFYDLCFFGSQHDLRGYEGGRYRDHAMVAVQGELRQALFWRLGVVAFAGVGAVAPSLGEIGQATPLPSAGVGLRFQPSSKIPVNISVDYAWGKGSSGLYLYVGEAF